MHDIERQALGDIARSLQILANGGEPLKGGAIGGTLNMMTGQQRQGETVEPVKPVSEIERELQRLERALSELSNIVGSLWSRAGLVVQPPSPTGDANCAMSIETAYSPAGNTIQCHALRVENIASELRNFSDSLAT